MMRSRIKNEDNEVKITKGNNIVYIEGHEIRSFIQFEIDRKLSFCFNGFVGKSIVVNRVEKKSTTKGHYKIVHIVFYVVSKIDSKAIENVNIQFSNQKKASGGSIYYIHPFKKGFEYSLKVKIKKDNNRNEDNSEEEFMVRKKYKRSMKNGKEKDFKNDKLFEKYQQWVPFLNQIENSPNPVLIQQLIIFAEKNFQQFQQPMSHVHRFQPPLPQTNPYILQTNPYILKERNTSHIERKRKRVVHQPLKKIFMNRNNGDKRKNVNILPNKKRKVQ